MIMKVSAHLIVNDNGRVRVTKGVPALDQNEIAIGIQVEIPKSYFTRPYPVFAINLPEPEPVPQPLVLDITSQAVASAMRVSVDRVRDGLTEMLEATDG